MFIELILNDESFEGHVEVGIKSNTFKLESIPSAQIKTYEPDEAIDRGFYLLTSKPNQASEKFEVYVGESKDLVTRIKRHLLDEKKVFEQAIIMYDVAGEMSGDHAKYIEETLIQFLNTHPNVTCGNGNKGQAPKLKPKHAKYCKDILEKTALVLQTLGYSFMRDWGLEAHAIRAKYALAETPQFPQVEEKTAVEVVESNSVNSEASFDFSQFPYFYIKNKKDHYTAQLKIKKKEFILLLGSKVRGWNLPSNDRKDRLKTLEKISKPVEGTKLLELTENLSCTSPSMAGQYVNGTTCAGWTEWKTADGETLEAVNARLGNPLGR